VQLLFDVRTLVFKAFQLLLNALACHW